MPSLKALKNLTDKIKNVSPYITVCGIGTGELSFVVETDMAIVTSQFKKLFVGPLDTDRDDCDQIEVSCRVDAKKLANFFASIQFLNSPMFCGILQDHALKIRIEIRPETYLNCVIPAVCV